MARFHIRKNARTGEVEQVPFTQVEEDAADAAAAIAAEQFARAAEVAQAKADARADNFVQQFVNMTPAQLIAYVNANVSNLADAKQLLTKLALMLLAIAKEQYK